MDGPPTDDSSHLTWANVGLGFSFIIFNAVVSTSLNLGVGSSLVTSALRCVVQLAIVGLLLQHVFETNDPWAISVIVCMYPSCTGDSKFTNDAKVLLNFMGTIEIGK